jgi:hypothetical protein
MGTFAQKVGRSPLRTAARGRTRSFSCAPEPRLRSQEDFKGLEFIRRALSTYRSDLEVRYRVDRADAAGTTWLEATRRDGATSMQTNYRSYFWPVGLAPGKATVM